LHGAAASVHQRIVIESIRAARSRKVHRLNLQLPPDAGHLQLPISGDVCDWAVGSGVE